MKRKNILAAFIIVFTVMLSSFGFYTWQIIYSPNILVDQDDRQFVIPPGSDFKDVQRLLYDQRFINDMVSFSFLSKLKKYDINVKPGVYLLKKEMTNLQAINLLRSGAQTPIKLTFTNVRKIEELPAKLAEIMAFDSAQMATLLLADTTAGYYDFDPSTLLSMFVPNTYEVYWTDSPKKLLDRMDKEYRNFWTADRVKKAAALGLSKTEVSTLASIVQAEDTQLKEPTRIAGVYVNRLKRGIPLQADPTVVYAVNDFSIRRVLTVHTRTESPYNTYINKGLPPGPINMPSIAAIDAVLNYEQHNYLYFCAKADFSGNHAFASTLREHNRNARAFQRALDAQRIYN
jgi:UPF0755 protein